MPGISVAEAKRVLQVSDWVLKQFPEVEHILSKTGRAENPNRSRAAVYAGDRNHPEGCVTSAPGCSSWAPDWLKPALRHITHGHDFLAGTDQAHGRAALRVPGVSNAWTMPIKATLTRLSTGIRTPVGLKISDSDVKTMEEIEEIGTKVQALSPSVRGTPRSVRRTHAGRVLPRR
jgi:Cu(I)/Ag(I) efflux system membrane protein CusA/SilA